MNGIVTGMILALVASGLTLIFGIMDVVNFAHGELFMLGAYVGVIVFAADRQFLARARAGRGGDRGDPRRRDADPDAAAADRARPAQHHPRHLRHFADPAELSCCGSSARWRARFHEPITTHFNLFYLEYPWYRLVIAGLSAAIIGLFWLFLKHSKFGVWIRATTQDRVMAQAMGIPVPWVYTGVFAIGAAMAAASGVLFAPMAGVSHTMGLDWVLKAFIVVVVGGMGSLGGSIAAAIFISLLEAYASIWVSPAQAVIVSFVVLILTLLFRPTGLFVPTPK